MFNRARTLGTLSWTYSRSSTVLLSFCCVTHHVSARFESATVSAAESYVAMQQQTYLFQQVIDLEVHLEDRLVPPLEMQCDNKRPRCRRGDHEEDVLPSNQVRVSSQSPRPRLLMNSPVVRHVTLHDDPLLLELHMREPVRAQ